MLRAALATALLAAPLTPASEAPGVADAEIVVLSTGGPGDPVAGQTVRMIEALETDGRLIYGRPSFDGEVFRHCVPEDPNPTGARRQCVRAAIPQRASAKPLVVILLGDTRERGSYQRMECIGPLSEGYLRSIYVRDFDHPRPDVAGGTRDAALGCIEQALAASR
ncbi:hypothetical protein [Brevundimonas fluminis]|jgi:hypothetical protein|uniref:hypothetical protein n=1 Tax=Brevundimonas fluminis TaxID=2487274 RepID=UPI000F657782|nr:hypothetical protein [Brevundimonas fluminis]